MVMVSRGGHIDVFCTLAWRPRWENTMQRWGEIPGVTCTRKDTCNEGSVNQTSLYLSLVGGLLIKYNGYHKHQL